MLVCSRLWVCAHACDQGNYECTCEDSCACGVGLGSVCEACLGVGCSCVVCLCVQMSSVVNTSTCGRARPSVLQASSGCRAPSSCNARPLPAAASLGVAQALGRVGSAVALAGSGPRLSSCGAGAPSAGLWRGIPGPGIEPVAPHWRVESTSLSPGELAVFLDVRVFVRI